MIDFAKKVDLRLCGDGTVLNALGWAVTASACWAARMRELVVQSFLQEMVSHFKLAVYDGANREFIRFKKKSFHSNFSRSP